MEQPNTTEVGDNIFVGASDTPTVFHSQYHSEHNPQPSWRRMPKSGFQNIGQIISTGITNFKNRFSKNSTRLSSDKKFAFNKTALYVIAGIILLIIAGSGYVLYFAAQSSKATAKNSVASGYVDNRVPLESVRSTQTINKDFNFPLYDQKGSAVSNFKYTIQSADLRDQVVVKGQTATAIKGKTFLIINLKLTNAYAKQIQINSRDYVRLVQDGSADQLAADMHSDPIAIDPASTKITRIGFSVDDSAKNMKLLVGEIKGTKTTIDLKF